MTIEGTLNIPERSGKIKDISRFDAGFFNVNPKQADVLDPLLRLLMEVVYEAVVDSGWLNHISSLCHQIDKIIFYKAMYDFKNYAAHKKHI